MFARKIASTKIGYCDIAENCKQNIEQKSKVETTRQNKQIDRMTHILHNNGGKIGCSGKVHIFCSTCGTPRVKYLYIFLHFDGLSI